MTVLLVSSWLLSFCFTDFVSGEDVNTLWVVVDNIIQAAMFFFSLKHMMKLPLKCCVILVALMLEIWEDFNVILFTSVHNLQHVVLFSVALHSVNSLMVTAGEWNNQSLVYFLNSPAPILKYYHVFIPTSIWQKKCY